MKIRFFMGVDDRQIQPRQSMDDVSAHYAWCLEQLILGLGQSQLEEASRYSLIEQFEKNMKASPGTRKMLDDVGGLFATLLKMNPLPNDDYIINFLKGMPVGDDRSYMYYTY